MAGVQIALESQGLGLSGALRIRDRSSEGLAAGATGVAQDSAGVTPAETSRRPQLVVSQGYVGTQCSFGAFHRVGLKGACG